MARDLSIIRSNPALSQLLQAGSGGLVGATLSRFFKGPALGRIRDLLVALADPDLDAVDDDGQATREDGSTVWLHWGATAVRGPRGEIDHYVVMFQDVAARHRFDAIAASNLDTLERLNRLKTEFMTMLRHEVRTGLVGIQGFSELMRDAEVLDLADARAFANEVYEGARLLDQRLEKMLELDHQPGSRAILSIADVSLNQVIGEVSATASARDGKHRIQTQLDPALSDVKGDWMKLAQLMSILLSNAIKYSPEGSEVAIVTRMVPGHVEVTVKDHGIGMPADFDRRLFGRYRFAADNPAMQLMGSGLGLPIARQIVEMHGGTIGFESQSGVGTTFRFTVPAPAAGARH